MTVLIILLALAAIVAIAALVVYNIVFRVTPKRTGGPCDVIPGAQYRPYDAETLRLVKKLMSREYEPVAISSFDGLKLFGRYYHVRDGAPLTVMVHGYMGVAERDFCGGFDAAVSAGRNVLLVDQRAHGRSEGRCLTFGVRERFDAQSWCRYAAERFGAETPIILCGISMGASTVLMASALELPKNVVCIVADCGYTSPREIIQSVMRRRELPVALLYPLVRLGARLYGGFDLESASAREATAKTAIPTLFIHGEDDHFVPCYMGEANYGACAAKKRLLTVPKAGHGLSYMLDREAYLEALSDFTNESLRAAGYSSTV